jgi:hypothetical protein
MSSNANIQVANPINADDYLKLSAIPLLDLKNDAKAQLLSILQSVRSF